MKREHYITLAHLFRYPTEDYREKINECMKLFKRDYPEAALKFERFHAFVNEKEPQEVEEVFGVTFHIQAICFLDIGYVIFGEDYKRGEFLVNMKREQAKINNDCGEELADNLPNFLSLMAKSDDDVLVEELAVAVLIPALTKMLDEFRAARLELRTKVLRKKQKIIILESAKEGNVYQSALDALLSAIKKDFENAHYKEVKIEPNLGNFMTNCGSCSTEKETTETIKTPTL